MKQIIFTSLFAASLLVACNEKQTNTSEEKVAIYRNPIIDKNCPDPTIIQATDGYFYVYTTQNSTNSEMQYVPIHKSKDLVNWEFAGTAFTEDARPTWEPEGRIWAPDINYIDGKYVLYYSKSKWGGINTCGIGVATSDKPEGPFTDKGMLFRSNEIGVTNSIDQFYIEDNGKKYLIWGSFYGIYCIELSADGLSLKEGAEKVQLAGTFTEGSYVHIHDGYYYLFGSAGSCCEGEKSTYTTVVARSKSLLGPYVDRQGEPALENHFEIVIEGNDKFVGTGHNSEIVTDDAGNDWILYHAYEKINPKKGRILMMDQIVWDEEGWPTVKGATASIEAPAPVFKK